MTDETEKKGESKKSRKARLWVFDPSAFQPLPRASFLRRHILGRMKSLVKFTLYSLAFSYPILLVSLGIVFGGLVFWGALIGSFVMAGLIIKKAGYSRNFEGWGVGNSRFLGLLVAFGLVVAFFYGFIHLQAWFFPIFGAVLVIAFLVVMRFSKR